MCAVPCTPCYMCGLRKMSGRHGSHHSFIRRFASPARTRPELTCGLRCRNWLRSAGAVSQEDGCEGQSTNLLRVGGWTHIEWCAHQCRASTPFAVSRSKGIEHSFSSSLYARLCARGHVVRVPVEAV